MKPDILASFFYSIQEILYGYDSNSFVDILEQNVTYYSFEQLPNQLIVRAEQKTFENTMKLIVNSMTLLLEEENESQKIWKIPLYMVTLTENGLNMENVQNQNLSILQLELYKIFTNFINLSLVFNKGENIISEKFKNLKRNNEILMYIFMILLVVFNLVLIMCNMRMIQIANYLYKKIMFNCFNCIEDANFKEYFDNKNQSLIYLSSLYIKSPNTLIKNIGTAKNKYLRSIQRQNKQIIQNHIKVNIQRDNEEAVYNRIMEIKDNSYQMKVFTKTTIFPLYLKNISFFVIYFIGIIICDIVLILYFNNVFNYHDFSVYIHSLENYLYNDLNLPVLYRFLNFTDEALNNLLQKQTESDGIINFYFRYTLYIYEHSNQLSVKNGYKKLSDYIPNTCDTIYNHLQDQNLKSFHNAFGLNDTEHLYSLEKIICEQMQFIKYGFVQFMYEEFILVGQALHNRYNKQSYDGLYKFYLDDDIYKSFMYVIFYIRPIMKYYATYIITPEILGKFSFYLKIVWVYLVLNIFFETVLFIVIKQFISKKVNEVKEYLLLFDSCIH